MLTPFLGSTNREIASVDSVEVRKNSASRLVYSLLFLLGILWLFRFFLSITEGESMGILVQSLTWALVSFIFGYQLYSGSKSMFNIQIRFIPYPSINNITIHSIDAERIADDREGQKQKILIQDRTSFYAVDTGVNDGCLRN